MLSCSIDDNYQVKLSCETQVTQDKINDLNYIIEDRYKTPKDLADIETIIQNGLLDGYVENMNECI